MFRRNLQCVIFSGIIMGPGVLFAQPPGRGGPPGGPHGGMRGGPPPEMILEIFQQADADGDGSATKAELTAAMQKMARGDRQGRRGLPPRQGNPPGEQLGPGGPPLHERGEGEHVHDHLGPPPQPGQVLPESIAESLNLSERQASQLAALQADVDKRLAAILTDEQKEQLENTRPPHGPPGHLEVEQGGQPASRPQRPRRPE